MRTRRVRRYTPLVLGGMLVLWLAEPALADTSEVGRNLGRELKSWGAALLFGVAGLVAIPALFRRDFKEALGILAIVILVGGFVFAPETVRAVLTDIWRVLPG
jgi:hypothetical protein